MNVWMGGSSIVLILTHILMIWYITNSCTYMSYFERVPVSIEYIERDFDVLLDALAAPLKLPPLKGQIQVIACVA